MSLDIVHAIMDEYALWRGTELIAQQEVDDAEARVIAADLRLQEAKAAHRDITAKVNKAHTRLAEAVEQHTAPSPLLYLTSDVT